VRAPPAGRALRLASSARSLRSPKPGKPRTRPSGRRQELFPAGDAQGRVQRAHALRTEPGDRQQLDQAARRVARELVDQREAAGAGDLGDLAGQVAADVREGGQVLARVQELVHGARQPAHAQRSSAVGAHAEGIRLLELEQVGRLLEDGGDLRVLDGNDRPPSPPAPALEELDRALVLSRARERREGAEVPALARAGVGLARVQPVLARRELPDHERLLPPCPRVPRRAPERRVCLRCPPDELRQDGAG